MKKLLLLLGLLIGINAYAQTNWSLSPLISAPQTLTGTWTNLGSEINTAKSNYINIMLKLDINSSQNFRLKMVCRHTSGGDNFSRLIQTPTASVVNVQTEYYELAVDADTNMVEVFALKGCPYVVFQVQVGTVGIPAGIVTEAKYALAF